MNTDSQLVAHRDTSKVTYEELKAIETPQSTRYWKPVSHVELIDTMVNDLKARGFGVAKQEFAVGGHGLKLFGTLDLDKVLVPDVGMAVGFMHSNDKSIAIKIVGGGRVFVCDNMALSGDIMILKQKHTWGFSLKDLIRRGLDRWQGKQERLVGDIGRMQETKLSDIDAQALLAKSLYDGVTTFQTFKLAYDLFFERSVRAPEQYPDVAPRSAWGLHNAFTRALKESNANVAFNTTIELAKVFHFGTEAAYA